MDFSNKEDLAKIDSKWKNIEFDSNKIYEKKIRDFITDEHVDIMVKYLYVKAYVEKENYDKYKKMYKKMQLKRVGYLDIDSFNIIIESFMKNGYLKEFPIPINKKGKILNGSHRLSCCLYFNINPYVVEFDEEDHTYDLEWFKNNDFSLEEINEIISVKNGLYIQYSEKKVDLNNVYAAMISPINEEGILAIDRFTKHANFLKENGIKGLFICGNTGNGINLSIDVKKSIVQTALSLKDFSVICHVGANTEKEIFDFVNYINETDVVCIACMPPYKIMNDFESIKRFYEQLAALSKKPVLMYHIPAITGIDLCYSQIVELLNINNIIGIKFTDSNLEKLNLIAKNVENKYIFFGKDDLLYDGLTNGATGGIGGCYNLFPSFVCNIINGNNPIENQEKLNFCIKKLRSIYPKIPGGEFVLKSLMLKKEMLDDDFLAELRRF